MLLEEAIHYLGNFGKFQKLQYAIACFGSLCCASNVIILVYLMYIPDHRCRIDELGAADTWQTPSEIVSQFVPRIDCPSSGGSREVCFSNCLLKTNATNSSEQACSHGYVYDRSDFIDTFASEQNLVCSSQNGVLATVLVQSQLIGVLLGAIIGGFLSDRFGRKPTLIAGLIMKAASAMSTALSSDVYSFWVLRCLAGIANAMIFQTSFVLGMEFIGASVRLHAGMVIEYWFSIGLMLAAGAAYLLRYWRWLTIAMGAMCLLSVPTFWFLRESPRWLISRGRYEEAEAIVREAAVMNKAELPKDFKLESAQGEAKSESILGAFRSLPLALMTLNQALQWFVIAMVYYGLSLGSGNLPGSVYLNSFFNALAEFVGFLIPHVAMGWIGRKPAHVVSMIIAGIALICTIFVEIFAAPNSLNWLMIALTMLGKIGISSAFAVVFLWTAELFPTTIRQIGVGMCSTFGRVGTLIAPFLADVEKFIVSSFGSALPQLIFGVLAVIAGLTAIFLPETKGLKLPDTLEDGEKLARNWRTNTVEPISASETDELKDPKSSHSSASTSSV